MKKIISTFVLIVFLIQTLTTNANVIFENISLIPNGMNISNLSESKINLFYQYLLQNRNLYNTSTLFEADKNKIVELNRKNIYNTNGLTNAGIFNANFDTGSYNFGYGKAFYDNNIAIIDATSGTGRHTYEAPYYCDLLISSLAKFKKIGNNICLANYTEFTNALTTNPDRSYISVIKPNEISLADLSKFGIIIFPDIVLNKHPQILDQLGQEGREKLKTFTNNGGILYFSSKSLLIAQKIDLLEGVVDENTLIKHHLNQGKLLIEKNTDFNTQVLNNGLYEGTNYSAKTGSGYYDYLIGSYVVSNFKDKTIVPIRYFDIGNDSNYYFQDLVSSENTLIDGEKSISAFYKPIGKGYIVYNGGNSLFSPSTNSHNLFINHTINGILFSFLREIYTSAKVIQKSNQDIQENLIPALETNIKFEYNMKAINVYKNNITNLTTTIQIATGVSLDSQLQTGCNNNGQTITCTKNLLNPSETREIKFNMLVNQPSFTQGGTDIQVTNTNLKYTNSLQQQVTQNLSKQTINSVESANMRASLNIDPAGYYPLPGAGIYIDQVLNTENKGPSEANETNYTAIIPVISPIFDENDQRILVSKLKFATTYHNSLYNSATKTNYYGFKNEGYCLISDYILGNRCKDFVIPGLLDTNKQIYVDNYDEPIYKQNSDEEEAISQINTGNVGTNLGKGIIKQTYLPDADKLFMHAKPRKMVREYPDKKELLFARQDIYFYNNPAFPLPKGITNNNQVISIDKRSSANGKICNSNLIQKQGTYGYPNGVKANEYANALECNSEKNILDRNNLPNGIEKTTYLYPIYSGNQITDASQLEGFDNNGNYIGQTDDFGNKSETYPIKLVKGNFTNFNLPERSTPKGGYLEFDVPNEISTGDINVLADHIAITKVTKEGNKAKIYFYRGKLPNEQSLKSIVGIAIKGYDQNISNNQIKVYSLKYNLGSSNINEYSLEQEITSNFEKFLFLEMPAVKLKFELPRRKRINQNSITNQGLTDGQIAVLFSNPEYYNSYVFKSTTLNNLNSLMNTAGLTQNQKTFLTNLFNTTNTESYVRKYENLEPFVRFGTYLQELAFHRTIRGPAEDHPISDPGIMSNFPLFANVGVVGISPIPFVEYLTTGIYQIIPMANENTRVEYKDIFGRNFATPIRSVIPEAAPLPPPVRDFMMNTTYELYDQNNKSYDFWDGETPLEIRQNVKLYNNYPKFFDPTLCVDNKPDTLYYGKCYDGTGSNTVGYSGQTNYSLLDKILGQTDFYWIKNIKLFNTRSEYNTFMSGLNQQLALSGLTNYTVPTLTRASDGKGNISLLNGEKLDDQAHNYSPEIEKYYPKNYIENNMRNLTHFDYDDSVYAKGYPYHMDNHLPNPNETIKLPHNIVAIPMFRGTNYKIKYFSNEPGYLEYEKNNYGKIEHNVSLYSSWKYTGKIGWWPENIQNRDDTLLAGQDSINQIPYIYNNNNYLKPGLIGTNNFSKVDNGSLNNIYSCLFNPYSINDNPNQYINKKNVLMNNVIPMIPWIQKGNENANYLNNYSCQGKFYSEDDLYKVNNIVETENAFWTYFGVNLRGHAKEALNLISRIVPYGSNIFEGDIKIVEGGRFVYRNPAFGPNAFQIVDNNVSVIKSINSDIQVEKELLPYTLKNYKTDAYLLYTIKDPGELFTDNLGNETARKWTDETYIDSRGNGNYASSIYVGSSYNGAATKSLLDPGEKTLLRLDLYNNSGYDWALLGTGKVANDNGQFKTYISGGIDFVISGQQSLNATDLINKVARNVLKPIRFNFINFEIPTEIQNYITIKPSDANIYTPGTFFDFDFVNVTTIRDGFKGSYFIDLQVDPSIPENLRGKVYEIKISLNEQYFEKLPGINGKDPVNWPNKPILPNIKFGIANSGNNAFYINGYSSGINLDISYNSGFTVDSIYQITDDGLDQLRLAAGDGTKKHQRLRETFENLCNSGYVLNTLSGNSILSGTNKKLSINFDQNGINQFPYTNLSGTIVPKMYVLVHLKNNGLTDGEHIIENNSSISFTNYAGKLKSKNNSTLLKGFAQGPSLDIWYKYGLIGNTTNEKLEIQKLAPGNNNIEVKLFLKNTGTDIAFDPTIKINVATGITIDSQKTQNIQSITNNEITFKNLYSITGSLGQEGEAVGPGITNYFPIYLTYSGNYQSNPINLVKNVKYEYIPFDPALPIISGNYTTGLALDFVKTNIEVLNTNLDNYNINLSGNSIGLYRDTYVDGNKTENKVSNSGSNIMTTQTTLDPTKAHTITGVAYFKTIGGSFSQIGKHKSITTPASAYINDNGSYFSGSKDFVLRLKTNKYSRYNGYYKISSNQGEYSSGFKQTGNDGNITTTINNIDITTGTTVNISLFENSTLLTGITINKSGINPNIRDTTAQNLNNKINIKFKVNKIKRTCYKIYEGNKLLTPNCVSISSELNSFIYGSGDILKDSVYSIKVFSNNGNKEILQATVNYSSSSTLNTIPIKIVGNENITGDINFNKRKDFGYSFNIDGTPIKFAIRNKNTFSHNSNNNEIQVEITGSQIMYVGSGWDKKLIGPKNINSSSFEISGYVLNKIIEVGNENTPIIFSNYNIITINNIWKKPAKLVIDHNNEKTTIDEYLSQNDLGTKQCWIYDNNKVIISTKKFSKYALYEQGSSSSSNNSSSSSSNMSSSSSSTNSTISNNSGGGGGGGSTYSIKADNCPYGDFSPSYYDNTCKGIEKIGTGNSSISLSDKDKQIINKGFEIFLRNLKTKGYNQNQIYILLGKIQTKLEQKINSAKFEYMKYILENTLNKLKTLTNLNSTTPKIEINNKPITNEITKPKIQKDKIKTIVHIAPNGKIYAIKESNGRFYIEGNSKSFKSLKLILDYINSNNKK